MRIALLIFSFLAPVALHAEGVPVAPATACRDQAILDLTSLAADAHKKGVDLPNMGSMFGENSRSLLRSLYKLIQSCPDKVFYRCVVEELATFHYPNELLGNMFGPNIDKAGLALFQIGSIWDKQEYLGETDPILLRLYNAIVIMGLNTGEEGLHLHSVGTGYYLGKFNGDHWVATNLHVIKENIDGLSPEAACKAFTYHLPSHGKVKYLGKGLLGLWPELDMVICSVDVKPEEESRFAGHELHYDFFTPALDLALVTMGFNSHNPKPGKPYYDSSPDCRIFLTQFMHQEGRWSMPVGCDVAKGDSGSPLLNKANGRVAGMMWATTELKMAFSSAELKAMQADPARHNFLWQELAQAIPAVKIGEVLCTPGKEWNKEFCAANR